MSIRSEKVAEILRRNISLLLKYKLHDVRLRKVIITRVCLAEKLSYAKVYYLLPEGKECKQTQHTLTKAVGAIRSALVNNVELRYMPALRFYYDDASAEKQRLDEIFSEIAAEEGMSI